MPDFRYDTASSFAANRFPPGVEGEAQWNKLLSDLEQIPPRGPITDYLDAFQGFHNDIQTEAVRGLIPRECRVFVSHKSQDIGFARSIAKIVATAGYGYWLDAEDPKLQWLNGQPIQSPAYDILVAAIIEIALLNSTHVIAVMTRNSSGSKWIPYEYGRAKDRLPASRNSAIWLEPGMPLAACGEYVRLGVITGRKQDIDDWLKLTAPCRPLPRPIWPTTGLPVDDLPDAEPTDWGVARPDE